MGIIIWHQYLDPVHLSHEESGDELERAKLEALAHIECVKARFVVQAVLLQPPFDELHRKTARIDRRAGVQGRVDLQQGAENHENCKLLRDR